DEREKESFSGKSLNFWQRWRLAQCAKRAKTKGKIAEVYGKLLAYLRQAFLAIENYGLEAGIFEQKGDIFYLEFAEIKQWVLSTVGLVEEGNLTKESPPTPLEQEGMLSETLLEKEEMTEPSVGCDEGNSTNNVASFEQRNLPQIRDEKLFDENSPLTPLEKEEMTEPSVGCDEGNSTNNVEVEEQNRRVLKVVSPSSPYPETFHSLRQLIRQRKEKLQKDSDRQVPSVVYGNVLPEQSQETISTEENVSILQGIPGSVGCVEGYVKVCRSSEVNLAESENLIIVVPYTDAGWAALLLNAKAIITEVGGQLSHGAIIAREYGIPAVMNISGAMTRLQDGQKVRVDGYRGTVELLSLGD
ncbi:MAG: PEP-utilizing enzyme, partial [Trichodesmium sp.]